MKRINPNPPSMAHGTVNGYKNIGCRCDKCRKAASKYHRTWMQAKPERLKKSAERAVVTYYKAKFKNKVDPVAEALVKYEYKPRRK